MIQLAEIIGSVSPLASINLPFSVHSSTDAHAADTVLFVFKVLQFFAMWPFFYK